MAHAIGTDHHEVAVGMDDFFDALPQLIWHEDEPIAWPSSVSLYFVSKLAPEQVKVVLTGEGSDELFGGLRPLSALTSFNTRWRIATEQSCPAGLRRLVRIADCGFAAC